MQSSLAFLLGLLSEPDPVCIAHEDFDGMHGEALRLWQRMGFVGREPQWNPRASCPFCNEGAPVMLKRRILCGECHSTIDRQHLLLWCLDLRAFLAWLAGALALRGDLRQADESLWQLGSVHRGERIAECFFLRSGQSSDAGRQRLLAYRQSIVLHPLQTPALPGFDERTVSLLELLHLYGGSLQVRDLLSLVQSRGQQAVRFDDRTGAIWLGDQVLGEVPMGSKEYGLLLLLWRRRDQYVPYSDLKRFVLEQTGSSDSTEEATFCQRLKNRIKKAVPAIDRLIAKTNKGDGYRLRTQLREV